MTDSLKNTIAATSIASRAFGVIASTVVPAPTVPSPALQKMSASFGYAPVFAGA